MPAFQLFDDFSRFGDRILHGVDREERPALKYKYLLGQINHLLSTTHRMVVTRLERIENASNASDAKAALDELGLEPLEESFRIEGLCDVFESFGNTLGEMAWRSESEGDTVAPDIGNIGDFAMRLRDREREVASIYTDEIQSIVNLDGWESDLPGLQEQASRAKKALTDQIADFAQKSKRFSTMSG